MQFYLNNTKIFAIYVLDELCRVIPTKWRLYRDHRLCDVTLSYVEVVIPKSISVCRPRLRRRRCVACKHFCVNVYKFRAHVASLNGARQK